MLLVVCCVVVVVVLEVADRRGLNELARKGCGVRTTKARDGSGVKVAVIIAEAFKEAIRLTRLVSIISTVSSICSRRLRTGVAAAVAGFFFCAAGLVFTGFFLLGVLLWLLLAFDVDCLNLLVEGPELDETDFEDVLGLLVLGDEEAGFLGNFLGVLIEVEDLVVSFLMALAEVDCAKELLEGETLSFSAKARTTACAFRLANL